MLVYGLTLSDSSVEHVNGHGRTFFGARPAAGAQIFVHVAGFSLYADFEIARFTTDFLDFAVSEKIYFGMPTDIQQLRRKNSDGAVIGGEGLVELRHPSTNTREPFHHVHLDSHFRQVQGRLNSCNPSADNQYVFIHNSPQEMVVTIKLCPPYKCLGHAFRNQGGKVFYLQLHILKIRKRAAQVNLALRASGNQGFGSGCLRFLETLDLDLL
jgi:hypothetical protein